MERALFQPTFKVDPFSRYILFIASGSRAFWFQIENAHFIPYMDLYEAILDRPLRKRSFDSWDIVCTCQQLSGGLLGGVEGPCMTRGQYYVGCASDLQ